MSSIRYTILSLSEVMEESNLIVEVECTDQYSEAILIKSKNPDTPAQSSTFIKKGLVFSVKGILKNSTGIVIPDKVIVPDENWRRSLSQHNEQQNNGPSKSFTVKKYDGGATSIKKASILFLYHFQGMFELSAKNSFEVSSAREKIDSLLSQQ